MNSSQAKVFKLIDAAKKGSYPLGDITYIENGLNSFGKYVNLVSRFSVSLEKIKIKHLDEKGRMFDRKSYQEDIKELDERRRINHNKVIGICNSFNKMCEEFGLEPFYTGNIEDRNEVADFIGKTIFELYTNEICREKYVIDKIAEDNVIIKENMSLDEIIKLCENNSDKMRYEKNDDKQL